MNYLDVILRVKKDLREEIGSPTENGFLDIDNCDLPTPNIRFCCVVADGKQKIE